MVVNPLSRPQRRALIGNIFHHLGEPDDALCDHTHRHARDWCECNDADWPAVRDWLCSTGGHCDCEVLFNTGPQIETERAQ